MRLKKGDKVPYAQIANEILFDRELSLKAKGLYAFMYAKPDGWNFTSRSMASQLKEETKAIQRILRELKEFGLISYKKNSNGTGVYTIHNTVKKPKSQNGTLGLSQNPISPLRRNVSKAKCTRISNKDISTNKDIYNNPDTTGHVFKQKLNLSPAADVFRKKLLASGYTGHLASVYIEYEREDVYLNEQGLLYTKTKKPNQILMSTLNEVWEELYNMHSAKYPNVKLF